MTLIDRPGPVERTDRTVSQHLKGTALGVEENWIKYALLKWICLNHILGTNWDQLEIAISTKELLFYSMNGNIRLDFILPKLSGYAIDVLSLNMIVIHHCI
jgi:hypothetical protein